MAKMGSGRGRGWLNVGENSRPGVDSNEPKLSKPQKSNQENNLYDNLIQLFIYFDPVDDGILLNEKIKHLRNVFMNTCKTEDEIRAAVQVIHKNCLKDEKFIEKFLILVTSALFCNADKHTKEQKIWRDTLRKIFICQLQENFEDREVLRNTEPIMFYNSLKLYSGYFRGLQKIPPYNCSIVEKFATIPYLNMLLDHKEYLDIRMFATMVCTSCEFLSLMYDKKKEDLLLLLDRLKLEIIRGNGLSEQEKLLLFFSWDLIQHKYILKPEDWTFYRKHLEDDEISDILIKCNLGMPKNECMRNAEDEKNDVQIIEENMARHSIDFQGSILKPPNAVDEKSSKKPSTFQRKANNEKSNSFNIHVESRLQQDKAEPLGRPILGVGARLKKM